MQSASHWIQTARGTAMPYLQWAIQTLHDSLGAFAFGFVCGAVFIVATVAMWFHSQLLSYDEEHRTRQRRIQARRMRAAEADDIDEGLKKKSTEKGYHEIETVQVDAGRSSMSRSESGPIQHHEFEVATLGPNTYCQHCTYMIYGVRKQGLICNTCKIVIHKRCLDKITAPCVALTGEDDDEQWWRPHPLLFEPSPRKRGYLNMKATLGNFKARILILHEGKLHFFKTENDMVPWGSIELTPNCQCLQNTSAGKDHCFDMVSRGEEGNQTWVMQASSRRVMLEWIDAIEGEMIKDLECVRTGVYACARDSGITHNFVLSDFAKEFHCQYCNELLLRLGTRGLICQDCNYICHEKCLQSILKPCGKKMSEGQLANAISVPLEPSSIGRTPSQSGQARKDDAEDSFEAGTGSNGASSSTSAPSSFVGASSKEEMETCEWFNQVLSAWFTDEKRAYFASKVQRKMEDKFKEKDRPSFLSDIIVERFDLGEALPRVTGVSVLPTDPSLEGELQANIHFEYRDEDVGAMVHIRTSVWINWPSQHYASIPAHIYVSVKQFTGVLRFRHSPTTDQTWFSMQSPPKTEFVIDSEIGNGYRFQNTKTIISYVRDKFNETLNNMIMWPNRIAVVTRANGQRKLKFVRKTNYVRKRDKEKAAAAASQANDEQMGKEYLQYMAHENHKEAQPVVFTGKLAPTSSVGGGVDVASTSAGGDGADAADGTQHTPNGNNHSENRSSASASPTATRHRRKPTISGSENGLGGMLAAGINPAFTTKTGGGSNTEDASAGKNAVPRRPPPALPARNEHTHVRRGHRRVASSSVAMSESTSPRVDGTGAGAGASSGGSQHKSLRRVGGSDSDLPTLQRSREGRLAAESNVNGVVESGKDKEKKDEEQAKGKGKEKQAVPPLPAPVQKREAAASSSSASASEQEKTTTERRSVFPPRSVFVQGMGGTKESPFAKLKRKMHIGSDSDSDSDSDKDDEKDKDKDKKKEHIGELKKEGKEQGK